MITDLLPRYYEAHGTNPTYTIVRSIVINGHEVAWMRYDGHVEHDIMKQGREGETFSGHELKCECDFTEGVGWKIMDDGRVCGLSLRNDKCLCVPVAEHLRRLELRREYLQRFETHGDMYFLKQFVPEIIFDLIEKGKAGEFLGESGKGTGTWGGYFYVQTLEKIIDLMPGDGFKIVRDMVAQKKIGLNGAIVEEYREPPPPKWEEWNRTTYPEGWVGICSLPTHSKMKQEWKLEVLRPDGTPTGEPVSVPLIYEPRFGPDMGDVAQAEEKLMELIREEKQKG